MTDRETLARAIGAALKSQMDKMTSEFVRNPDMGLLHIDLLALADAALAAMKPAPDEAPR